MITSCGVATSDPGADPAIAPGLRREFLDFRLRLVEALRSLPDLQYYTSQDNFKRPEATAQRGEA